MLDAFVAFEMTLHRERQIEGIARAKARGRYMGRPATIDSVRVRELRGQGVTPTGIAKALGISRASVFRALGGPVAFVDAELAQQSEAARVEALKQGRAS